MTISSVFLFSLLWFITNLEKITASLDSLPPEPDSSDLSDSSTTSSFKSSSSTELCDELGEIDSEDATTSMSEYGSSPHYRLRSSNLSLLDDDKSESEQNQPKSDLPSDVCEHKSSEPPNFASPPNPNEEHILNVLLTSSIMANEQLNKEKALNEGSACSSIEVTDFSSPNYEFKAFSDHCDNDTPKGQLSGSELSPSIDSRISLVDKEPGQSSSQDLETALEHMKIDALEILLSSQTLESIRSDSRTDFYQKTDCDRRSNDESTESFAGRTNLGPFSINRETEIALERILSENTEVLKKVNQTYSSFESKCGDSISRQGSQDTLFDTLPNNNFPNFNVTDCSEGPPSGSLLGDPEEYSETDFRAPESSCTSECNCDIPSCPQDVSIFDNLTNTNDLELNLNQSGNDVENISEDTEPCYLQTSLPDFVVAPSAIVDRKNILENELRSQVFSNNTRLKCQTDDEHEEPKDNRKRKKYKSLDNLHILPKSKLKIGLVSRAGKWISISIDNSDLVVFNHLPDNLIENVKLSSEGTRKADWKKSEIERKTDLNEFELSKKSCDAPKDPYLHLNFDIIAPGRRRRDPIEQYVHKKNMISQNFRAPELTAINFNPFPSKPNSRPPKELGVKLGLYSSSKK